ncbi:DUF3750 domain-containing protein [Desulfospira joergensenii]|uniref:DUF3750 domain-containing protein n=1 Tax=Desulfospira joergensenii TaxID=53329 RepID=UPI0003B4C5C1|nr:DUF3750 domain-containing protein [Desulfospira joergensenii]
MKKNGIFYPKESKSRIILPAVVLILFGLAGCSADKDWRTASREPAGILPDPQKSSEAVLAVLGADAWSWRGWFAIHTWIAAKKTGESVYTVYDVVGWRGHRGRPVLGVRQDIPDRYWYGSRPELIQLKKGKGVDELIDKVDKAAKTYPWKTTYKAFPGPNSNTFTAWIGLLVPELEMDLPFSAIGSGYAKKTDFRPQE